VAEESRSDLSGRLERTLITFEKKLGVHEQGMCDVGHRAIETQGTWHAQDEDGAILRGQEAELPSQGLGQSCRDM
jgi:hypothetical protein